MNEELHDLLKVARLYYNENYTQQKIAKKMSLSRIKIHRMLIKAKNEGLVQIYIHDPAENYSELEILFEKIYGLRECVIVPSSSDNETVYAYMGKALSRILEYNLRSDSYFGVGWGTTIRGVAENVNLKDKVKARIIPMFGGLSSSVEHIHSNSIAALLAAKVGGIAYVLNCPAIVENPEAKSLFMNESTVQEVFAKTGSISTAIVSISHVGEDMTIRRLNIVSREDSEELLENEIIGDVNANFFNRSGRLVHNKLEDRMINMKIDDLARNRNVIGIAFGSKKAMAIKTALNAGLLNTLITDKETADVINTLD
jgi:DNA-binding transcriptional regulator LsrR (DeoR family)